MKKFHLSLLLACFAVLNTLAVNVSVTMNYMSRTMTLAEKGSGNLVNVGTVGGTTTAPLYTFDADPGTYILTGYGSTGVANGTIEISVYENGDMQDGGSQDGKVFKITTITAYASNSGWVLGTDYTMQCNATSREGAARVITTTIGSVAAGRETFLMNIGDSYRLNYTSSQARINEGFLPSFVHSNTVTGAYGNALIAIPKATTYSLTIPKDASLFVGGKQGAIIQSSGGTHYIPFAEMTAESVSTSGDKATYQFKLGENCNYNYRVSQEGKLTNGGIFTVSANGTLEITQADLDQASPKMIDHDVTHNSYSNVADILMNINGRGHLNMSLNQKRQLINLRSWQLTDTQTNNYFIEPDYHYQIVDENGNTVNNVIRINDKQEIEAIGEGTAIVQVTYDAINLRIHKNNAATNYMFGPLFGAIWPENTGTFVVTVGGADNSGIKPNMNIQEDLRANADGKSTTLDSEHDVLYYLEGQAGYSYTFKPEGVASVSLANPTIETNSSKYSGFQNITANEDGSYTALLTYGRNIIKLTSSNGSSVYQVVSAKPAGYTVTNKSRPDKAIMPGDDISVQFHGFFHPANKLSGIYNMSAYLVYNGLPNGNSLILSPNQYTFGGDPKAQVFQYHVDADWDPATPFQLRQGAIQINGYGSTIGKHRDISVIGGINPNFTAVVRVDYFGSIPNIDIPLASPIDGFKFKGLPLETEIIVKNDVKDTIQANPQGEYLGTYRTYSYEIYADGYKTAMGTHTVAEGDGIKDINIEMVAVTDPKWDGTSMLRPKQVTALEADEDGGEFENMEGYYKITNGYELRWVAYQTEVGKGTLSAILTDDIDLNDKLWSPIGTNPNNDATCNYSGVFEGNHKTVKGLYINGSAAYQALFGYVKNATVRNLTTEGVVEKGSAAMFASLNGTFIIDNCHNKANVTGGQTLGGLIGGTAVGTVGSSVKNSSNSGNVNAGRNMYAGGFAGQLFSGTYENCWNTGTVTTTNGFSGGFSGSSRSTIINCYNTGAISANGYYVGGLVGYAEEGSIQNSYNTGAITNPAEDGSGAIKGVGTEATVTNCYAPENLGTNVYAEGATLKPTEAFTSGEVAWLLGNVFKQEIGSEDSPELDGKSVYRISYTNNLNAEVATIFTNGTLPTIAKEGYSSKWLTAANGNDISSVSADANLYVKFVDDATNMEENQDSFSVYPNPFVDYIIVNSKALETAYLYDATGKQVAVFELSLGENRIDVSGLSKGSYILKTTTSSKKLIK